MKKKPAAKTTPAAATPALVSVSLLGGPYCGDDWDVLANSHQIDLPNGTHYVFCPHATALRGRDIFLHSTVDAFLCAR